jgi:type VI secretion system ImpJ/VasE family protein
MRFEEQLHWSDGQFLQPHHFQYLQRVTSSYLRQNRVFALAYPWGLIDFEPDIDALSGGRVVVKRLSAVLPSGVEISMPGNCTIPPLDLAPALAQNPDTLLVSLALPNWSEYEANLADEENEKAGKRIYQSQKRRLRDENSGENEITIITRKLNVRLITNLDESADMETMPILKLDVRSHGLVEGAAILDESYIGPFMLLSADCPLIPMLTSLLADMKQSRDKALDTLTVERFSPDKFSGANAYTAERLKILNLYIQRISSLISPPSKASPFGIYLELSSLLSELMSFDPINSIRAIMPYDHLNLGQGFSELFKDIRSFLLAGGGIAYVKLDFKAESDGIYLSVPINTENISNVKEAYLAIHCEAPEDDVVKALEAGDTFKLISPAMKQVRARGIKLTNTPFPPRFLPVLKNTLWFKLELEESVRVWREVCEGRQMLIDCALRLFPGLKATLYLVQGQ